MSPDNITTPNNNFSVKLWLDDNFRGYQNNIFSPCALGCFRFYSSFEIALGIL
jgi:hypothetical protein